MNRRGITPALVASIFIAGCMLIGSGGSEPVEFSHRLHVQDEQLECAMCHEDLAFDDAPGMPSLDTCLLCHAELEEQAAEGAGEGDEPRGVATLFRAPEGDPDGDPVFAARRVAALDDEVLFSHLLHVDAELECSSCHTGIEDAVGIDASLAVPMGKCVDCHDKTGQPSECATCHTRVGIDWAPANHALGWERLHGKIARASFDAGVGPGGEIPAAESCSLCHDESTCSTCHRTEPPRSHTNGFRLKAHGMLARMDRESCATCHEPASCERCHAETVPLSHGGMWGGTKAMHCIGCHTPLESNGCAVCHKATPSHASATPKPAWHDPAMNCTGCHGVDAPLPHVDNGENCNLCHF